jgi:hypothetical protein
MIVAGMDQVPKKAGILSRGNGDFSMSRGTSLDGARNGRASCDFPTLQPN